MKIMSIHRDIKPGNILIDCHSPKLTDFDLSKFLDPDGETSMMNSNVGTNAYKAPEFFNRIGGKLRYHRNVDIYAAGLTFLAMIQAQEGNRKLVPHIETPRDDSELHVQSIGQLIAERIKYNVPELNIVRVSSVEVAPAPTTDVPVDNIRSIRRLIQKMTCVGPKERLTADQVQLHLDKVTYNMSSIFLLYVFDDN